MSFRFSNHKILGRWLPSWISFSHLIRLKIPNYNFAYSHKEVSLTEGVQDGQEALIIEHMIHLFGKPDVSFQISMFSS